MATGSSCVFPRVAVFQYLYEPPIIMIQKHINVEQLFVYM